MILGAGRRGKESSPEAPVSAAGLRPRRAMASGVVRNAIPCAVGTETHRAKPKWCCRPKQVAGWRGATGGLSASALGARIGKPSRDRKGAVTCHCRMQIAECRMQDERQRGVAGHVLSRAGLRRAGFALADGQRHVRLVAWSQARSGRGYTNSLHFVRLGNEIRKRRNQ
jgi:hypothetical protein